MNMHMSHDYRVYIPETQFKLESLGRAEEQSDMDIGGSSAQINWYVDTSKKKVWLGKVGGNDDISKVFHEVISNKLYRDVFKHTKKVKVPKAVASEVAILKGQATKIYGLKEGTKAFSIMSKKVSEFQEFGKDLISQLKAAPRKPLTVKNPANPSETFPVTSFWSLAAYSKWFGDVDFLGTIGGNAGFQIKQNEATGAYYCRTVKIDPGYVGYGEGSTEADIQIKDLVYSTSTEMISLDSLLPEEKKEFYETLQEIVSYTDKDIRQMLVDFDTQGLTNEQKDNFNSQAMRLEKILIARRDALKELFKEELKALPPYKKTGVDMNYSDVDVVVGNLFSKKIGVIFNGLSAGIGLVASKLLKY